ncbi:hypothetical protein PPC_3935 [Pseudomonas protegens Cab57]|nr:hypothetical protein PPC_3935 [Pseudomonas protegens Cab57]
MLQRPFCGAGLHLGVLSTGEGGLEDAFAGKPAPTGEVGRGGLHQKFTEALNRAVNGAPWNR